MTRDLKEEYARRKDAHLGRIAASLEDYIRRLIFRVPRVDRISARAKDVHRFLDKAQKRKSSGELKYENPLAEIQDQIGARIVVYYLRDVEAVAEIVKDYFTPVEEKSLVPEKDSEFGYFGKHFVLHLPADVLTDGDKHAEVPDFFELQIKTLFQHAWAEAEHDLGYKPERPLSSDEKRKVAFSAAQAWGADMIFDDLFKIMQINGSNATDSPDFN